MAYKKTEKDIKACLLFINLIEGSKAICKALHWQAPDLNVRDKRGAHKYLDDFHDVLSKYQDILAECSQGILGVFLNPKVVKGEVKKEITLPIELVDFLMENTTYFIENLPKDAIWVGIKSETETFIKDLEQYKYLFSMV